MSAAKEAAPGAGAVRYRPYPAYKHSGVEWLGEIPAHWEALRNLALFDDRREKGHPDLPIYSVTQAAGVIPQDEVDIKIVRPSDNREGYKRIVRGDLVYNKMRMWQGAVGTSPATGIVSPAYVVCAPRRPIITRYFEYQYRTPLIITECGRFSYGICDDMNSLRFEDFKGIYSLVPPESEQRAIAAFLDRETARIDALVAKKERLIELLQEKRTALITRAVTKGLDPTVPMKDSGVEWLGEIPAHWEVEVNRWLFRESDVRSQLGTEELLTVSHITGVTRRSEKPDVTMIEAESHEGYKICGNGELAINTMWAWMGALGIAHEHGMVSPSYNVYRIAHTGLVPQYYDYLCRIPLHVAEIIRHSKGIWQSRLRLYPDAFREIMTPVPPRDEQRAIAAFLDRETARIDALVAKVREAIERLKELRTALISAAVTGKIDVREEVSLDGTLVTP